MPRPARRVIAFDARRLRACRSPSASRPARPRSGRSSAPCGPASFGRSSPTWRPRKPSSRSTRAADRDGRTADERGPRPSWASTSGRTRSRPGSSRSTGASSGLPRRLPHRPVGRPRLGRAGSGRLVVRRGRRGPRPAAPDLGEVVAIGVTATARRSCRRRPRRGDPAGDHLARRPGDRGGRAPGGRDRHPRLGARRVPGRALGGAPRAGRRRRTRWYLSTWEWLGLRLTGVAVAPFVPDQPIPDPALVAVPGPSDRCCPRRRAARSSGG